MYRLRRVQKKRLYYLNLVRTLQDCNQARRIAHNILKSFDMMWRFIQDRAIEPANNFAQKTNQASNELSEKFFIHVV
jgi:hypothetical protein